MTTVGKGLRAALAEAFTLDRPAVVPSRCRRTAPASGCCACPRRPLLDRGAEVESVYIPEVDRRRALRLLPGRLHAELHLLPHRHAAPGAQPDRRRDRGPGGGRPRRARRLAGRAPPDGAFVPSDGGASCPTSSSWAWASRSTISTTSSAAHRRDHATTRASPSRAGGSPSRPPASCRRWQRLGEEANAMLADLAPRGPRRPARRTGAAQPQVPDPRAARTPAAPIRACPTPAASPSST